MVTNLRLKMRHGFGFIFVGFGPVEGAGGAGKYNGNSKYGDPSLRSRMTTFEGCDSGLVGGQVSLGGVGCG